MLKKGEIMKTKTTFIYTTEDYRCPGCDISLKEDFELAHGDINKENYYLRGNRKNEGTV